MIYKCPVINGKPYWVPIVVKNRDFLIGYIRGGIDREFLFKDVMKSHGIDVENAGEDVFLDSSRFNDVLENGKRESELSDAELNAYYEEMVKEKIQKMEDHHPDNEHVFDDCFLTIECQCGLGYYSFKEENDIPKEKFVCAQCQRILIDYTGHDDEDYEFDGKDRR